MALSDPTQTRTTNLQTKTTDYTAGEEPWNKNIQSYDIDSFGTEVSTYQCDWDKWHGMYRSIAELRSTIDVWSKWIVGKKLIVDDRTNKIISRIKGNNKDTFRQILINIKRTSKVGGDCYAEIIRDKAKRLINLKILDPGSIRVHSDNLGIIKKYEQVTEKANQSNLISTKAKVLSTWEPDEIFHIMNDRIGDEIHGIPEAEKLQKLIKIRHQGMDDYTVVLHRYGKPTFFYEATTDDETELEAIKDKIDNAVKNFENVIVPKDTLTNIERTSTPQYSMIDPIPWFKFLRSYFTESSNVPDLIRGKSDEVSLAAGKLNYLGYKEKIEMEQIEYSEQIELQLGLKIKFEAPKEIDIESNPFMKTDSNKKKESGETDKISKNG